MSVSFAESLAQKCFACETVLRGAQAAALSKADIEDLAAYFAAQKGLTVKR